MNEIDSTKINAGFLAIVLIVGTFTALSPSFLIGAHAQQYGMDQKYNSYESDYGMNNYDDKQSYGKDSKSYDKSKDSSSNVIIKKIKCNNFNLNVNGFSGNEIGTLPTDLNGLATEAQASDEGEIGASSTGSGSGSDGLSSGPNTDSRFVCINNNNNNNVGGETPVTPEPPIPTNLDLAVVNFVDNDVSILLGNGDGTFNAATPATVGVGSFPFSVAVGDFNGDTNLDLAVANFNNGAASTVSILLGNGDGTFDPATPATINVGNGPISIAVGLFDGDNFQDLAVANRDSNYVSILLGNGDGTFDPATPATVNVGNSPLFVAAGFFDGDNFLDLAVANAGDDNVSILLGNGDGTFDPATPATVGVGDLPQFIAVGLFDGDNFLDLAVANGGSGVGNDDVSILLGNGDGTFDPATPATVGVGDGPGGIAVGLFDGDNFLDLAVANAASDNVSILLGNGDGTFDPATPATINVGDFSFSVVAGDFNGDLNLDLAVTNGGDDNVSILLGNGDGTFDPATPATVDVGDNPIALAVGEFDGL